MHVTNWRARHLSTLRDSYSLPPSTRDCLTFITLDIQSTPHFILSQRIETQSLPRCYRLRTPDPKSQPLLGLSISNLISKTRVLKHRILEGKRRSNANASVLGTQRFGAPNFHSPSLRLCHFHTPDSTYASSRSRIQPCFSKQSMKQCYQSSIIKPFGHTPRKSTPVVPPFL